MSEKTEEKKSFSIEKAQHFRACGKLISSAWWGPHQSNHIADPSSYCRGFENYPNAIKPARFTIQFQYMLLHIQPILVKFDRLAAQITAEEWSDLHDIERSGEVQALRRTERELREAWKGRPKAR